MESKYNRINSLREVMIRKGTIATYDSERHITLIDMRPDVKVCTERARLMTQMYKQTEGEPEIIRRAKAFSFFLDNMSIYIDPYQLIVGNEASRQECVPVYPEICNETLRDAVSRGQFKRRLSEEEEEELKDILSYWQTRTVEARVRSILPDDLVDYLDFGDNFVMGVVWGRGRCLADFKILFEQGLKGRIDRASQKLEHLKRVQQNGGNGSREIISQANFYEAAIMVCQAVCRWAQRYAGLAAQLAADEKDQERKNELLEIGEICNWVPYNPPRTFHEALQFFYFTHLAQRLELISHAAGYRLDQILYPFYKRDIKNGRLTRNKAQMLLECLWLKIEDCQDLATTSPSKVGSASGALGWENFCIGGVKEDGSDATNEVSYLMLDATMDCRALTPYLILRYSDKLPDSLIDKAIDLLATGHGQPSLFNDNIIIPYLEKVYNLPIELARKYTMIACVRWGLEGKCLYPMFPNVAVGSALRFLELALSQGVDKFTGKQTGYPTSDPLTWEHFDDAQQAYLKQVEFFADKLSRVTNIATVIYAEYTQRPFSSALQEDCLETGKDEIKCMYRQMLTCPFVGFANVANSLAVLKKLIFEDKTVKMKELLETLKHNWDGYEVLRQTAINNVPKYGNDEPYVDELMKWVYTETNRIWGTFHGLYGGTYVLEGSVASGPWAVSVGTGATPDGRKDREACADGTLSPVGGSDKLGPTAALKSVAYLNPLETGWGGLLNQKFLPQTLAGDGREKFKSYLRTYLQFPIWHVQFNVVSADTLREAQRNTTKYENLVVRVAGYSAYFVNLHKEVQDDLIRRTEQCVE